MKALLIMLLVLLAIACSKPAEQSTSTGDSTAATAPVQDPSEQPVNVVIWNEVGIRDTPSEKGKYLTSIYLSEQFEITGDTASEMSGSKRIHYHKIKLSDGTVGWVHDEFVAIHVRPAVTTEEESVYKRPDMAAITEKTFKRGDFLVIRKVEGQFVEVTGKSIGDKWFTTGFIKEDNVSYDHDDVKYAATMRRAAEETKEKIKATLQAELDDQDLFGESLLWNQDHGFPGQMGHAGEGVDDPSDEADPETVTPMDRRTVDLGAYKDGQLAYYPLNSPTAEDLSGNGNDGTSSNVNASNDIMEFNGNSFITINSLKVKPPFTVAAYFSLKDTRLHDQCVVSQGRSPDGTGFNFGYTLNESGQPIFYLGLIGAKPVGASAPADIKPGEWVYLAATVNDRIVKLYVNGERVVAATLSDEDAQLVAQNLADSPMPVEIGRELENLDRYFSGWIDNVALWDHELLDREIRDMYK